MAEPDGTVGIETTGEVKAPIDADAALDAEEELDEAEGSDGAEDAEEELDEAEGSEGAEDAAEPPRRRLVSELLEGQEIVDGGPRGDLQLVAPPLHLETIDAGQPIYQLDLSSDEPQGEMIEPEPAAPGAIDTEPAAAPDAADVLSSIPADIGAREALKQMIVQRDRQVMNAERDGIGAYELAVGVDQFVEALLEAARRA